MEEDIKTYLIAINAAILGGIEVMKVYDSGNFETEIKDDNSPVTLADKNSSDVIIKELEKTNIPILCEEITPPTYKERKKWKKLWVVDPLDGTKEFIKKTDSFCVNIALIEDESPVFGVIYIPVKKELYYGGKKYGTYKIENVSGILKLDNIVSALKLKVPVKNDVKIVIGAYGRIKNDLIELLIHHNIVFSDRYYVSLPSAIKFCHLAEGKSDVYPRLYPCMEWDTAAGHAIVQGIGKEIYDLDTNLPLVYNKEDLYSPFFIVK